MLSAFPMTALRRTKEEIAFLILSCSRQGLLHTAWSPLVQGFLGLGAFLRVGKSQISLPVGLARKDNPPLDECGTFLGPSALCVYCPPRRPVFFEAVCLVQWQGLMKTPDPQET